MADERLVEAVRSFACQGKKVKDLRAKENAWREIASQVDYCAGSMLATLQKD